jgi:hypothetical protein
VAGHFCAGAPWLITTFTFIRYSGPDSVFMVACLTAALELGLFVVCMALSLGLRQASPGFARGVMSGWAGGMLAIPCGGTAMAGLLAALG